MQTQHGSTLLESLIRTWIRWKPRIKRFTPILMALITYVSFRILTSWSVAAIALAAVLVHEYGHLFAAKRLGLKVSGPHFVPFFGAFIRLEGEIKTRWEDVYVALAGPLAGMLMATLFTVLYVVTGNPYCAVITFITGLLNIFQLLPVLPLDGGRAFRGIVFSINHYFGYAAASLVVLVPVVLAIFGYVTIFLLFAPIMGGTIAWEAYAHFKHKPVPVSMSKKQTLVAIGLYLLQLMVLSTSIVIAVLSASGQHTLDVLYRF